MSDLNLPFLAVIDVRTFHIFKQTYPVFRSVREIKAQNIVPGIFLTYSFLHENLDNCLNWIFSPPLGHVPTCRI